MFQIFQKLFSTKHFQLILQALKTFQEILKKFIALTCQTLMNKNLQEKNHYE